MMNLSGLILIVIVALWGSLLVPALVRKHDNVTEVRSVDRFSYALRILSRRTPYFPGRRDVLVQRKSAEARRPAVSPAPGFVADVSAGTVRRPARATARAKARGTAQRSALAAKRRRMLFILSLSLVLCVGLAFRSGGHWWLTVAITGMVTVMYLTYLRGEADRLATVERRQAQARRRAARPAAPARVAAPVRRAAPASAATAAEALGPANLADGSWAPVPVTLPTYVTKPVISRPTVAPPSGGWYDGVLAEQRAGRYASGSDVYDQMSDDEVATGDYLGLSRDDGELYGLDGLDAILERRRAVND